MIRKRICSIILAISQILSAAYVFAEEDKALPQEKTAIQMETALQKDAETAANQGGEAENASDNYVVPENEIQIFVSPNGSDSNAGTYQLPLKSITAGIAKGISAMGSANGKKVSVVLRGGDYYISDTITLNAATSGTKDNPFVIQGFQGEKVNVKMSKKLIPTMFSQLTDKNVLDKVPAESRKYIGVYNLSGILKSSDTNNQNLILNDNEQTVARWPNKGFDRVDKIVGIKAFTGKEAGGRASRWANVSSAFVNGYFGVEYSYSSISLSSASGSEITLESKPYYGIGTNNRYYIENLIQELDNPGEYYIDVKEKLLYFYPPYNIAGADIELSESNNTMIYGKGLSNIVLKNINFSGTQGNGIVFENCNNIIVDNCEVKHIGKTGITVSDSKNCAIRNSTICFTGKYGISMTGGDRNTLTQSNNVIENNHIYDFALKDRAGSFGIWTDGVGTLIQHNLIHNSSGSAIRFGGNDHKILYNEMYNVVNEQCDAGAIYSGRNYTYRGIEVAYNYIHDIDTTADKSGSIFVAAIYYDDLMSSANTHHNILYKCNLGIMIGGGRDHKFENNIVADCENGLFFDARGIGWAAYHAAKGGQAYNSILAVPYNKAPWKETYPELASILDKPEDLGIPMNNSVKDNILYKCLSNMVASEFKEYGVYENVLEDKMDGSYFEDAKNRNFNLKKDSDEAKKFPGIAEIDMSLMGLLKDKSESEIKKAQEAGFRLISPLNGKDGISNLSCNFTWDKHNGSDKYIVRIAEDPEMKNVIIEQEVNQNAADIKYIPSGKKACWWTVTGVNTSQSMPGSFQQLGAPRLLISVLNEKTDRKELIANIELCQKLYNGLREGNSPGTFKKGYKEKVKQALDTAIAANESDNVKQKEIEAASNGITAVIGELSQNLNYDTMNIKDMIADQTGWSTTDGKFTFGNDGTLTLSGSAGKATHYEVCGYDASLPECTAIKFGYKVNVSSNYCIIALQNAADQFLKAGYQIIIKSNQLEIQKRVDAMVGDPIKATMLNFYIPDNKWVELEFGALQLDIGTYVFLKSDGYLAADFLDTEAPQWTGDVKFSFTNPSGSAADCTASIREAKED